METIVSENLRRVGSSVSDLSSISNDKIDETRPRRVSLDKISTSNHISIVPEGIKEFIELSPDKQTIIRKKSFVWSNESRFNDSKIEIFCDIVGDNFMVH